MARSKHPWQDHPELLTNICNPYDQIQKVDWNFSKFEDAIFTRPCDPQAVIYTSLDFCVAIVSLRDWTEKFVKRRFRSRKMTLPAPISSADEFRSYVDKEVRWQKAIEAIANTSKHAQYRDQGWPQGIARPATFYPPQLKDEREACEDGLEVFAFMHKYKELTWWDLSLRQHPSNDATPGYEAFGDALDDWSKLLGKFGLDER